jgi:hypothetical protein
MITLLGARFSPLGSLPIDYFPLSIAHCLLPIAYCRLSTAYSLPPSLASPLVRLFAFPFILFSYFPFSD